jgi:transposase
MYSEVGRPSVAPEKLLRAQLLQMLYSVRSERLLVCLEKSSLTCR